MKIIAIATITVAVLTAVPALAASPQQCVVGLVSAEWNKGEIPFSFMEKEFGYLAKMSCAEAHDKAAVLNALHNNNDRGLTPVEAKVYRLK